MKIAVTAASGHLGGEIIKHLLNELSSDQIVGIARTPDKAKSLGVEIREGDYDNKLHFDKALQDVDVVLLVSGMDKPEKRIQQHRNVIQAAAEAGVKKIVYTSILGPEEGTSFSPIVQSNRQTERDIKNSGLQWAIGRDGLYIEPDIEYIDGYKKTGTVSNCAGDGKCAYTTRSELGYAYAHLLLTDASNGNVFALAGEPLTQTRLVDFLNDTFDLDLVYKYIDPETFRKQRVEELGEHLGNIIVGIYDGIHKDSFDVQSDYVKATGRPHIAWVDYFSQLGAN